MRRWLPCCNLKAVAAVLLPGILFTRVSLDTAGGVMAGAMADLDALLARSSVARASEGHHGGVKRSDAALLQLAAAAAFAGDHASWAPDGQRPGCANPTRPPTLPNVPVAGDYASWAPNGQRPGCANPTLPTLPSVPRCAGPRPAKARGGRGLAQGARTIRLVARRCGCTGWDGRSIDAEYSCP